MAVRVTAAHTAEARAEAGREASEGGVAAAAALSSGGFLGLPAPFSEEGNEATEAWYGRGAGGSARAAMYSLARIQAPRVSAKPSQLSQVSLRTASNPLGRVQRLIGSPFLQPLGVDLAKQTLLAPFQHSIALGPASPLPLGP